MEFTRRDTVKVVAGGLGSSVALSATSALRSDREDGGSGTVEDVSDSERRRLLALADVVYPTRVEVTAEFVLSYVRSQSGERRSAMRTAGDRLDERSLSRYGAPFAELSADERETILEKMGVDRSQPDPDGTVPEQVRYYLINGLLLALFTHPKGSRLVGIANPRGHPGGYESYAEDPTG